MCPRPSRLSNCMAARLQSRPHHARRVARKHKIHTSALYKANVLKALAMTPLAVVSKDRKSHPDWYLKASLAVSPHACHVCTIKSTSSEVLRQILHRLAVVCSMRCGFPPIAPAAIRETVVRNMPAADQERSHVPRLNERFRASVSLL